MHLIVRSIAHALVIAIVSFALTPLVVAKEAQEPRTKKSKVLRVRTFGDPLSFDWNRVFTPVEATLVRNMMEGLVSIELDRSTPKARSARKMRAAAALAQKWKISPDGKTYTFFLRKNVRWSDGKPLHARHFVESWKRLLTPEFKASYAYLLFDIENAEAYASGKVKDFSKVGVRAVDAHTLEVRLRAPIAYWIWIPTFWATFPVRSDLMEKFGHEWDRPGKLVTLGPFTLDSYEKDRKVVLKRNPSYYGKRGNVDLVISALVKDDAAAVKLYENNQIDFVTKIPSADTVRMAGRPDLKRWPEARIVHLDFNPHQAPTDDVAVRKAISMAIDKSKIPKLIGGANTPATSFVTPGIMSHSSTVGLPYNVDRARGLLAKAGWRDGKRLELDLVTVGFADEVAVAKFIATELETNLGAMVRLHVYEPKQFYSPAVSFGGFSMLLNRWTADFPDPDNFYSIFLSNAGNNRVAWKNSRYDELIKSARSLSDSRAREKLYRAAQILLVEEEVIATPMYYGQNSALVRLSVTGFEPTPTNSYLFKDFSLR